MADLSPGLSRRPSPQSFSRSAGQLRPPPGRPPRPPRPSIPPRGGKAAPEPERAGQDEAEPEQARQRRGEPLAVGAEGELGEGEQQETEGEERVELLLGASLDQEVLPEDDPGPARVAHGASSTESVRLS